MLGVENAVLGLLVQRWLLEAAAARSLCRIRKADRSCALPVGEPLWANGIQAVAGQWKDTRSSAIGPFTTSLPPNMSFSLCVIERPDLRWASHLLQPRKVLCTTALSHVPDGAPWLHFLRKGSAAFPDARSWHSTRYSRRWIAWRLWSGMRPESRFASRVSSQRPHDSQST